MAGTRTRSPSSAATAPVRKWRPKASRCSRPSPSSRTSSSSSPISTGAATATSRPAKRSPDDGLDQLRKFDAILLGAVGHPDVAPGILERKLLLDLRFGLDQYINLRPVKLFPGVEIAAARTRARTTSTSSSSARTPKTSTAASRASCTRARRTKSPRKPPSTPAGLRALRPLRLRAHPQAQQPQGQEAHARRQDQRASSATTSGGARSRKSAQRIPRHREGLQPRRRLLHVDREEPRVLRRDRHDEHVRRHHHRPLAASSKAAWASPPAATSTPTRRRQHVRADGRQRPEVHRHRQDQPDRRHQRREHDARPARRTESRPSA